MPAMPDLRGRDERSTVTELHAISRLALAGVSPGILEQNDFASEITVEGAGEVFRMLFRRRGGLMAIAASSGGNRILTMYYVWTIDGMTPRGFYTVARRTLAPLQYTMKAHSHGYRLKLHGVQKRGTEVGDHWFPMKHTV